MHRFFIPPEWIKGDSVTITGSQAHQIRNVLRAKPGDSITVLDNTGMAYDVNVVDITSQKVTGEVSLSYKCQSEPDVEIVLYQALLKGSRFDWVLQKCTELGVSAFVPMICQRCVAESPGEIKLSRWRQIVTEAAEQSKRGRIPEILPVKNFRETVESFDGLSLMPWEGESVKGIKSGLMANPNLKKVNLFIGPEGGFSDSEAEFAARLGVKTVTLGKRILRAETAGLVAASAVFYEAGELDGCSFA